MTFGVFNLNLLSWYVLAMEAWKAFRILHVLVVYSIHQYVKIHIKTVVEIMSKVSWSTLTPHLD